MGLHQAVVCGITGNELSKKITGTSEVSVGRSAVAVGSGATAGALAGAGIVIGTAALGVASAPVTVPLTVAAGFISGLASLFD